MSDILDQIVAVKRDEVPAARALCSEAALRDLAAAQSAPRGFAAALAGDTLVPFDLTGARTAVEAFRACGQVPSA